MDPSTPTTPATPTNYPFSTPSIDTPPGFPVEHHQIFGNQPTFYDDDDDPTRIGFSTQHRIQFGQNDDELTLPGFTLQHQLCFGESSAADKSKWISISIVWYRIFFFLNFHMHFFSSEMPSAMSSG